MLQNWLKPLSEATLNSINPLSEGSFGKNLLLYTSKNLPSLASARVALLGVGDNECTVTRAFLYQLAQGFPNGAIADLGQVRRATPSVIISVIYELITGGIVPIVFGAPDSLAHLQFLAYQNAKALVNLAAIDEKLRFDNALPKVGYGPIFSPRHPLLLHFALIGYQQHLTYPAQLDWLENLTFESVRLGRSRQSPEETEPILRDVDLLCMHLSALKHCEAPGVTGQTPSGFTIEEACQLARYAGLSDKLTSFGIYGHNTSEDLHSQTAQAEALLIWYFIDGIFNRKNDYPVSKDGLTEYIVDFRQLNYQLTFWKSIKSGRWWLQVPHADAKQHERHRLVPCSFQDYQSACRNELPDRLMQAFRRFG